MVRLLLSGSRETWLKAQRYTWSHSVHVPRVYLGKVGLTYWDRSGRLVAFMYPPPCVGVPRQNDPPPFSWPARFYLLSVALRAPSLFQPSASKAERRTRESYEIRGRESSEAVASIRKKDKRLPRIYLVSRNTFCATGILLSLRYLIISSKGEKLSSH